MKRKVFSMLLCALLSVTLLTGAAWAEVLIAGREVSGGGYYKNNADNTGVDNTGDSGDYNAHYDSDSSTLYLNDLNVTSNATLYGGTFKYAIYTDSDMTLNLSGNNTVTTVEKPSSSPVPAPQPSANVAVSVGGSLTVTGDGTLNASAGSGAVNSNGIDVINGIKVESGTLNASAGSASTSVGIACNNSIEVSDDATVIATGGKGSRQSAGIVAGDNISLDEGAIIASADTTSPKANAGITKGVTLPESYYWRTSPTGEYKHYPEDEYTPSLSDTYVEVSTQLKASPSAGASVFIFTIEKTEDGYLVSAEYDSFFTVWVDGETLAAENYTVKAENGKTLVKLNEDYLATLEKGEHTLRVNFTIGFAQTTFTVK